MNILKRYVDDFGNGRDLDAADAETLLDTLITDVDEQLLADVFRAWNAKGITGDEIFSIARIMRDRCTRVVAKHERFVDIVGSGGSRGKTFNVSTAAAFVAAGAGVPVAKHGNKAATSNSGSADVLAALGVEPAVDAATAERCLNEIGICFMFAPNFHRLSPTLAKVRRGLGFPTIFNCVGPLCNPADAPHRLIGVWSQDIVPKMAEALARLGTRKSWIVHGSEGLDEISLNGISFVAEVEDGGVSNFEIAAPDSMATSGRGNGVRVESASESAGVIKRILNGMESGRAAENIVVLNAAAALYLAGAAESFEDGIGVARDSIQKGKAKQKLNELAQAVKQ